MRHYEFATRLDEKAPVQAPQIQQILDAGTVQQAIMKAGYSDIKPNGNKLNVLIEIPAGQNKGEYRTKVLQDLLGKLNQLLPNNKPTYSKDPSLSSLGGIIFQNSRVSVVIKDVGKQGEKSAGVANEATLANLLGNIIKKYGSVDVTFVDPRGKKLSISNATSIELVGKDTADRKKSDAILIGKKGRLPISLKQLDADAWESADTLFGQRAKGIIQKLQDDGVIQLEVIGNRTNKRTGQETPVYKLTKEIVVEPTPEEAMNAIFGTDLNPNGGVVIQTFKEEHFVQEGNNVTIEAHAVIAKPEDIPESHMMVWLIRNDSTRANPLPGLRTLGVTLTRGIGKKGTKDVILVDVNGNVVKNPNIK